MIILNDSVTGPLMRRVMANSSMKIYLRNRVIHTTNESTQNLTHVMAGMTLYCLDFKKSILCNTKFVVTAKELRTPAGQPSQREEKQVT